MLYFCLLSLALFILFLILFLKLLKILILFSCLFSKIFEFHLASFSSSFDEFISSLYFIVQSSYVFFVLIVNVIWILCQSIQFQFDPHVLFDLGRQLCLKILLVYFKWLNLISQILQIHLHRLFHIEHFYIVFFQLLIIIHSAQMLILLVFKFDSPIFSGFWVRNNFSFCIVQ